MKSEKVLAKDRVGNKISLFSYIDDGRQFYDLMTDGRVLLTKTLAQKLAAKLLEFAKVEAQK